MNSPQAVGLYVLLPAVLATVIAYSAVWLREKFRAWTRRVSATLDHCLADLDHDDDLMAVADVVAVQPTVGADCLEPNVHILTGCPRCYAVLEVITEITGLSNRNLTAMRRAQGIAS